MTTPIYVPYSSEAKLSLLTVEALKPYADRVHYRWVGYSDTAYWELVNTLWHEGNDVIIVEQDIVPPADVIPSFDVCHFWFCTAKYQYSTRNDHIYGGNEHKGWLGGLGCCRFSHRLMELYPNAIENAGNLERAYRGAHPARHWCALDGAIKDELWFRDVWPCGNHPESHHMHTQTSHGCDRRNEPPLIHFQGVYPVTK
jgi:hypothetical protein